MLYARGRHRHSTTGPNKTEAMYAQQLEMLKQAGEVLWYAFQPVKLRLADSTYYTPDFLVMVKDLTLEAHEIKGHWEDDARVKIKVAAETLPIRFVAIRKEGKSWVTDVIGEHL